MKTSHLTHLTLKGLLVLLAAASANRLSTVNEVAAKAKAMRLTPPLSMSSGAPPSTSSTACQANKTLESANRTETANAADGVPGRTRPAKGPKCPAPEPPRLTAAARKPNIAAQ